MSHVSSSNIKSVMAFAELVGEILDADKSGTRSSKLDAMRFAQSAAGVCEGIDRSHPSFDEAFDELVEKLKKEVYDKSFNDAISMMNCGDLEPASAFKQAASDNGISYGDAMGDFVDWAMEKIG